MTISLWNLAAYSVQLAVLALTAIGCATFLRLRTPRLALWFWQATMLAALLLPLAQPRREATGAVFAALTSFTSSTPREALDATLMINATSILLAAIAIGIVARLLWLGVGLLRVRSLLRTSVTDEALAPVIDDLSQQLNTAAAVRICADLEGPATIGAMRPVVLLPTSVLAMPRAVQRAIICHELVHVRRKDWLHTIAEEVWCALLWFHPAARLIAARASLARETVVDETTILLTRDRRAYAEALLAFSNPQPHVVGLTPFIGRHTLRQRVALIAAEDSTPRHRAVAGLVIALAASASLTAASVDRFPMSDGVRRVFDLGPNSGITLPVVVREVKPAYTAAAMREKIQGSVWLRCVVSATGDITDVQVTRSLDTEYGLDDEAVAAAKKWKFKPAQKDGTPVAVRITIELTFTLRK